MSKDGTKRSRPRDSESREATEKAPPKKKHVWSGLTFFPEGGLFLNIGGLAKHRTQFGEALLLPGMQHAPCNEAGVLVLFGMLAERLGFIVESVRQPFPDCLAKQALDAGRRRWRHVRIEFEYLSSNFQLHGHDPEGCDLIVCWEHDWHACPLDVIELRWVVRELTAPRKNPSRGVSVWRPSARIAADYRR